MADAWPIEAVGTPATFEFAVKLARPAGHIANTGVLKVVLGRE